MEKLFKCFFIESYEVSNDTVMIRLQKDTYGRHFNIIWKTFPACANHNFTFPTWGPLNGATQTKPLTYVCVSRPRYVNMSRYSGRYIFGLSSAHPGCKLYVKNYVHLACGIICLLYHTISTNQYFCNKWYYKDGYAVWCYRTSSNENRQNQSTTYDQLDND